MSTKTTEKLIHAFVTSRIDSCNALLFGIPEKDLSKLQTVQNCAARLIERAKRRDPVTPMLTRLHWLPVDKRIASVLTPYLPQRNLRSSSKQLLVVPTSSTSTYGDRAFASASPILWNKLPDNLKTETDTSSFMKSLKTIPIREIFHFHHLPKLYFGLNITLEIKDRPYRHQNNYIWTNF